VPGNNGAVGLYHHVPARHGQSDSESAGKRRDEQMAGLTPKERLEQKLEEARQELLQREQRLKVKGDYGLGVGDPLVVRWEFNLALRQELEARIRMLEDALERLEQGSYGICRVCGQAISPERLEVLPEAATCIHCAEGKN
jgi:DnaK suppressor protein